MYKMLGFIMPAVSRMEKKKDIMKKLHIMNTHTFKKLNEDIRL